jgi:hypothetical protein
VNFNNNALGCNSPEEVEEACESVDIFEYEKEAEIIIFPNPAADRITITSNDISKLERVNIYNQLGQKVLTNHRIRDVIDVSILDQGIYIVELEFDEIKVRKKLIIN